MVRQHARQSDGDPSTDGVASSAAAAESADPALDASHNPNRWFELQATASGDLHRQFMFEFAPGREVVRAISPSAADPEVFAGLKAEAVHVRGREEHLRPHGGGEEAGVVEALLEIVSP